MKYLICFILFIIPLFLQAQNEDQDNDAERNFISEVTLGTDLVYRLHGGLLLKYRWDNNLVIAAHTNVGRSYWSMGKIVDIPSGSFESINFTLSQRFGGGYEFGSGRFRHTILGLAGPNYYRLKESHSIPDIENMDVTVSTWITDAGFLYGLNIGSSEKFFTLQLYLPVMLIPDNLMGATLSFGIGFK